MEIIKSRATLLLLIPSLQTAYSIITCIEVKHRHCPCALLSWYPLLRDVAALCFSILVCLWEPGVFRLRLEGVAWVGNMTDSTLLLSIPWNQCCASWRTSSSCKALVLALGSGYKPWVSSASSGPWLFPACAQHRWVRWVWLQRQEASKSLQIAMGSLLFTR